MVYGRTSFFPLQIRRTTRERQTSTYAHHTTHAEDKIHGSPATNLIQQRAKDEASEIQHVYLSMLDDPPQDHHAHILRTYNQQATERAHQLRRTPALFEGIPLSEKTCVYEWDRTEEIERERVSKITGAKQTLQKEEANASHKQVITKNTKEEADTSRPPAKTSPTQVHPPPPEKRLHSKHAGLGTKTSKDSALCTSPKPKPCLAN